LFEDVVFLQNFGLSAVDRGRKFWQEIRHPSYPPDGEAGKPKK